MNELYKGIFLFFGGIVIGAMSFMMITGCETLDPIFHKFDMNNIFLIIGIMMSLGCLIVGSSIIVSSLGLYII